MQKCFKGGPQKEWFFKETCFTINICKYRFKKEICLKNPRILGLENVTCISIKSLANVGKKLETKLEYLTQNPAKNLTMFQIPKFNFKISLVLISILWYPKYIDI